MKILIQRVTRGCVRVGDAIVGQTGPGLVVLVGVREGDAEADARTLAQKTANLRVFADDQQRMNRSLLDTGGGVLAISQFTLYADTHKGNRPSFIRAGKPELAERLVGVYVETLRAVLGAERVATGRFGAMMAVELVNDGPVTIALDTDEE
jgi:D-tyrosyl-tRNA(Tyr) deacylase